MNTYKAVFGGKTLAEHENMKDACKVLWDHVRKVVAAGDMALQVLETAVWVEGPRILKEIKHAEHSTSEKALRYYAEKPSRVTRSISDTIDANAAVAAHDAQKQVWMFYDMRDYSYEQGWIDEDTHEFVE